MSSIRHGNHTDHGLSDDDSYTYQIPLIIGAAAIAMTGLLIGCCYCLNIQDNHLYQIFSE